MLSEPFSDWWCCLNSREQSTLQALVFVWPSGLGYIERSTYEVIVTVTGENSCIKMHDHFRFEYGLQYGTVPNGEDPPIEVVFFDAEFWSAMYAFALTDDFICSAPCKLRTFPD